MSNIIKFENIIKDNITITFIDVIANDDYLKITSINALDKAGYEISPCGVKQFQKDNYLNKTGEFGIKELAIAIQVFDNDKVQNIYDYINKLKIDFEEIKKAEELRKKKELRSNTIAGIFVFILCLFILFIFGYGFVHFTRDVYSWIKSLL